MFVSDPPPYERTTDNVFAPVSLTARHTRPAICDGDTTFRSCLVIFWPLEITPKAAAYPGNSLDSTVMGRPLKICSTLGCCCKNAHVCATLASHLLSTLVGSGTAQVNAASYSKSLSMHSGQLALGQVLPSYCICPEKDFTLMVPQSEVIVSPASNEVIWRSASPSLSRAVCLATWLFAGGEGERCLIFRLAGEEEPVFPPSPS